VGLLKLNRQTPLESKLMNYQSDILAKVAAQSKVLQGKRAFVLGIANEHSIAYGCARVFRQLGAEIAVTYLNEKARRFVEPLARDLGAVPPPVCETPD
jgi:enoyl-[acyl-carrier protein] reductase I